MVCGICECLLTVQLHFEILRQMCYKLLWHGEQVLHVLDLLKVKRHVGGEYDLNDQCSQFSDIYTVAQHNAISHAN